MEDLRLAATESCENSGNVVDQLGVAPLSDTESVLKLIKFLLEHLLVVLASKQVEAVDAESFDIGAVTGDDGGDTLHSLIPLTILNVNLTFLIEDWSEVGVEDVDLRQCSQAFVVALGLFKDFCAAQQCLQVLAVAALLLVEDRLEEVHCLLLKVVLHG